MPQGPSGSLAAEGSGRGWGQGLWQESPFHSGALTGLLLPLCWDQGHS